MDPLHHGYVSSLTVKAVIAVTFLGFLIAKGDDGSAPPSQQAIDERNDRIDPTGLQRAWSHALNDQKLQPKDKLVAAVKVIATARNRFDPNFNPNDYETFPFAPPYIADGAEMTSAEIAQYEDAHWKYTLKAMYVTREVKKVELYRMLVKFTRFDMGNLIAKMTALEIADVMNQVSAPPDVKRAIKTDVFDKKPLPH